MIIDVKKMIFYTPLRGQTRTMAQMADVQIPYATHGAGTFTYKTGP